jgi:hypothetical protein
MNIIMTDITVSTCSIEIESIQSFIFCKDYGVSGCYLSHNNKQEKLNFGNWVSYSPQVKDEHCTVD